MTKHLPRSKLMKSRFRKTLPCPVCKKIKRSDKLNQHLIICKNKQNFYLQNSSTNAAINLN